MATLVIVNPHAAGGRARHLWQTIEPLLWERLGDLVVAITEHPEDVTEHLDQAINLGLDQVLTIGGDGTNYFVCNALAELALSHPNAPLPSFGNLPIGTGRDWARTLGLPLEPAKAIDWIATATRVPVDMGCVQHAEGSLHFLNVASVGISGAIDARVNAIQQRRAWTFLEQTVRALLTYQPVPLRVFLDGELWYEGGAFMAAVANGRNFGHGMHVAPDAKINDGLFDVVLVEDLSRPTALRALPTLYSGTHIHRDDVHTGRASDVRIESPAESLDIDLDGEYYVMKDLHFSVKPGLIPMLCHPDPDETILLSR